MCDGVTPGSDIISLSICTISLLSSYPSSLIPHQLTKKPEDYPDAKGQPHVMVAARRKAAGKRDGVGAVGGWGDDMG